MSPRRSRRPRAARSNIRAEKAGIVQAGVGKASFTEQALVENIKAFVGAISRGQAGRRQGHLHQDASACSTTMGPGVKLDIASVAGEGATQQ